MFRPTQFGKYYLTERIAVGGMAELFKAKLFGVSGFEKPMVVKQILPKYARNAEFIKMFIDEAKIAVTLTHGNIVPVYELGKIDGVYFIAMEYVPGKDLADILETARSKNLVLTIEHAVFLAIEISKGLDYAHRRTDPDGNPLRVVHRDISPPNVLVSFGGEVKITDFGIAKATHKLGSTEAGVVKGTFGYMSPEQVRGLPVNHKTDIFSAGILLHEMLTGRRLFVGESEYDAIERVKAAKVPAPSSINPRVPSAIDPIVFKALAKDPADRYADANELQLALSRFLFTSGSGATATSLGRYMQQLFGDEAERRAESAGSEEIASQLPGREIDVTLREGPGVRPRSEDSQIFAARAELGHAPTVVSEHPAPELLLSSDGTTVDARAQRRPQVVDVGAGKGVPLSATMALPSLGPDEAALLSRELEDERTNVFKGARPPQRPEVPELRFPPKAEKEPRLARSEPLPSPGPLQGFPSSEELAALADALDEVEAKPPSKLPAPSGRPERAPTPPRSRAPSPMAAPIPATPPSEPAPPPRPSREEAVAAAAKSTSDSGLLGLLARPPSTEYAPVGASPSVELPAVEPPISDEEEPPPTQPRTDPASAPPRSSPREVASRTGSERLQPGRPKRISGIVSSTMRLFVDGIEDEEPAPAPDQPALEEAGSAELDQVPRTIKPTVLGWGVILLVVLGAAGFVIYKKTNLFRTPVDEGGDLVRPEDLKRASQKPGEKKGTIQLASAPEGASFFQFVGETPATLAELDPGRTYLLRLEREGYHPVYQTVDAKSWGGSQKAQLKVTLNPAGAGAEESLPAIAETTATGKQGSLQVASDPPMAMVWLLVGKGGKVELGNLDATRSYNFKALLKGHQQVLVNVAPVDFDKKTGTYKTVVRLEPDGPPTEAGAKPSPDAAAKPEPKVEPKPEPKVEPKPEPKVEPKPEPKVKVQPKLKLQPKVKVQPKFKVQPKIKRPPPKKKKKDEKKVGPKLPDWAK